MKSLTKFLRSEDGAALAEYGLLVALIAVVCILAVTTLGSNVRTALKDAADGIAK